MSDHLADHVLEQMGKLATIRSIEGRPVSLSPVVVKLLVDELLSNRRAGRMQLDLAQELEKLVECITRGGKLKDVPEGVRAIGMSATFVGRIAWKLRGLPMPKGVR